MNGKLKQWKKNLNKSILATKQISSFQAIIEIGEEEKIVCVSVNQRGQPAETKKPNSYIITCVVPGSSAGDLKNSLAMVFKEKLENDLIAAQEFFKKYFPNETLYPSDVLPLLDQNGRVTAAKPSFKVRRG